MGVIAISVKQTILSLLKIPFLNETIALRRITAKRIHISHNEESLNKTNEGHDFCKMSTNFEDLKNGPCILPLLIRNDVLCSYLPTYKLTDGHVLDAFPLGRRGKGVGIS